MSGGELLQTFDVTVAAAMNLLYWGGCYGGVCRFLPRPPVHERMLATVVLGSSLLFSGLQILSLGNQLRQLPGLAFAASVAVLGMLLYWRRTPDTDSSSVLPPMSETKPPALTRLARVAIVVLLIALSWLALRLLVRGLLLPVAPVSDAPIYHLYFALQWFKSGTTQLVPTPFGELAATYFPANGSLWFCWLTLGCQSELLAKVGQWPYLLAGGLAVYALSRDLGAGRHAAWVPAAVWCSTPLCHWYASIANVDLLYAAFYLCAAHYLIRYSQEDHRFRHVLLFGLASGCALGTKTIAVAFLPLLWLVFLFHVVRRDRRILTLLLATAGLLTPSLFWYLRNALVTGNPLYPLEVRVFGVTVFPGWYESSAMLQSGYHLPVENWRLLLDRLTLVLDLRLAWLWPVCVVFSLAAGCWRLLRKLGRHTSTGGQAARGTRDISCQAGWLAACALLSAAYLAIYWLVLPYNSQERFLAPALGLGLAPLGLWLTRRNWATIGCVLLVGWHLFFPQWATQLASPSDTWMTRTSTILSPANASELAIPLSLAIALAVLLLGRRRTAGESLSKIRITAAGLVTLAGVVLAGLPFTEAMHKEPTVRFYPPVDFGLRMFPAWHTLETASRENGGAVAYAGTNLPYYLFGMHLQNDVRYVNVNAPPGWLLHDYHLHQSRGLSRDPYPQWYRENPQLQQWLENLKQANIQYLFIARENMHGRRYQAPGPAPFPIEHQWAQQHPELFELLGPNSLPPDGVPWAWVYRLRSQPSGNVE